MVTLLQLWDEDDRAHVIAPLFELGNDGFVRRIACRNVLALSIAGASLKYRQLHDKNNGARS
jgi:hypothetical protein